MASENNIQQVVGSGKFVTVTPVVQIYAPYKILNSQTVVSFLNAGGTVTSAANQIAIDLNITSSVGSYALLRSRRVLKYRPGIVNTVRFGYDFDVGVANFIQFGGMQNEGNQISFAMIGTDFVVRKQSGGRLEIRTLTITAAETGAATATVTLAGVPFAVPLTNAGGTLSFTAFEIANFSYTGWTVTHVDDEVIFSSSTIVAPAPITGTFSYSSTGASTGTFVRSQIGVVATNLDILQVDWNGNSEMIQKLIPTNFNSYEIEYSWLGGGNIDFRVLNGRDGKFETVHSMRFANNGTDISLEQPNMFAAVGLISEGSTTAMMSKVSGMFAGTFGPTSIRSPLYGLSNERTIAANTETVILVIKNRLVVNNTINQSVVLIERFSASADGNRPVQLRLIKNPTTLSAGLTTDYTNYQFVDETESLTVFDTTALTFTGGSTLDAHIIGKDGSIAIDYFERELELFQSETIIVTALSTLSNVVNLSLNVLEDA